MKNLIKKLTYASPEVERFMLEKELCTVNSSPNSTLEPLVYNGIIDEDF